MLGSDGVALPLASQDTATAIASAYDPIWCPAGQPPVPGANGCTQSYSSFDALLTGLSGNAAYQGAGTIYVQQGTYAGDESIINFDSSSYNLGNIRNFDLTVQGGWDTTTNTVDPTKNTLFEGVPITVGTTANPWGGSLTFNNIQISWANNPASLILNTTQDITLDNVVISESASGNGAELNAGGSININNSKFDDNKNIGAVINAKGNVNIANSTFSNYSNRLNLVDQPQGSGALITSGGAVSLYDVYANANREVGVHIDAGGDVTIGSILGCAHNIVNSGGSNANNCSSFSGTKFSTTSSAGVITFLGYGLQVFTPGAINIDLITANDNYLWGADLNAGGNVTISNSIFNGNTTDSTVFIDDTGLLIKSGGLVSLNNVQADNNRLFGAIIKATGPQGVFINNSSFSNNKGTTIGSGGVPTFFGYGLQVVSDGSIYLNGVTASNNNLAGAQLNAGSATVSGDIGINNSTFSNNSTGSTTDRQGRGLEMVTNGFAFLTNVVADKNQLYGADVQANNDVYLDGITATNNGLDGVSVKSNCMTVFLTNGTYSNNGQYGLKIIDSALNQSGLPIFATNGAGDIFENPGTCVFSTPTAPTTDPVNTGSSTTDPTNTGSTTTDPVNTGSSTTDPTNTGSTTTDPTNTGSSTTDSENTESSNTDPVVESPTITLTDPLQVVSLDGGDVDAPASNNHHAKTDPKFTHSGNVTLHSILTDKNKSFNRSLLSNDNLNGLFGIFSGKYIYVYSTCDRTAPIGYGVLVVFLDPAFADLGNSN